MLLVVVLRGLERVPPEELPPLSTGTTEVSRCKALGVLGVVRVVRRVVPVGLEVLEVVRVVRQGVGGPVVAAVAPSAWAASPQRATTGWVAVSQPATTCEHCPAESLCALRARASWPVPATVRGRA